MEDALYTSVKVIGRQRFWGKVASVWASWVILNVNVNMINDGARNIFANIPK